MAQQAIPPAEPLRQTTAKTASEKAGTASVTIADYRYNDLLWENDLTAHRIYQRALEPVEPPSSSGVDLWGKRSSTPIMDVMLRAGAQHLDRGDGVDFFHVGTSRGVGGSGIWHDNKLWVSRNYQDATITQGRGRCARFSVTYDPWPVGTGLAVSETKRFTLQSGTHFTRVVATLAASHDQPLLAAIAIGRRNVGQEDGALEVDVRRGTMTVWTAPDPEHGSMALAVAVDPDELVRFTKDDANYLALVRVTPGQPFVYYFGGTWPRAQGVSSPEVWRERVKRARFDFDASADMSPVCD